MTLIEISRRYGKRPFVLFADNFHFVPSMTPLYSSFSAHLGRCSVIASSLALIVSSATAQTITKAPSPPPTPSISAPVEAAPLGDTVLATGPLGTSVQVYDILSEIQRAPEQVRQNLLARPDAVAQLVNNLLVRRILAKEAQRDGLAKDPVVNATIAIATDRALSDARLARMDAQNAPNDAQLDSYAQSFYKANPAKFDVPAQTRVRHILMANSGPDSLAKAKAVLDQLKSGASFAEMAKTHSIDSANSNQGGEIGFFSAGQMVRPFEDAVNKLVKPGDLSEPVETQFGYHIIQLEERREKGRQSYEEVRPQLLAEARTTVLNEARVQKVQALNKDMTIDKAAIESFVKAQPKAR